MKTTNTLVETLKSELEKLETGLGGRKHEIEKAYKTAIDAASKTRSEALETLKSENDEIAKIKKAITALGGDTSTKTKTTRAKKEITGDAPSFNVPSSAGEATTNDQKVYLAIKELGSTTVKSLQSSKLPVLEGLNEKAISNSVNFLRNKFGVVVSGGKEGKADLVKIK